MVSELGRKPNLKHDLNADRRCLCAFGQSARQAVSQPASFYLGSPSYLVTFLPAPGVGLRKNLEPRSQSVECRSHGWSKVAGAISNLLICLNYGVFQSSCLLAASVKSIGCGCFFLFSFFLFLCAYHFFSLTFFFVRGA